MKKVFLVIEPGFQLYKEPILKDIAASSGHPIVIATGLSSKVPCEWAEKHSSGRINFTYGDDKKSAKQIIRELSKLQMEVVGVTSYIQTSINLVNELQHELKLPVLSELRNFSLRNKGEIRKQLERSGVSQGEFCLMSERKNVEALPINLIKTMIVKPSDMMASLAVRKVNTRSEALKAYDLARDADFKGEDLRQLYGNLSNDVILEEYIEGPEYSVETCVIDGSCKIIGITQKSISKDGFFSEVGHFFPANLSEEDIVKISDLIVKTHSALKLINVVTHTEVRIREGTPFMIEINCRVAGGLITEVIKKSIGLSVGGLLYFVHSGNGSKALSLIERSLKRPPIPTWIHFISSKKEGRIEKILQPPLSLRKNFKKHVEVNDLIYHGDLTGESRLGHIILQRKISESLISKLTSIFVVSEPLAIIDLLDDKLFVFEANSKDTSSLSQLEQSVWDKIHQASLSTIRKRIKNWPGHTFIAVSLQSQMVVGSIFMVSGPRALIKRPFRPWAYFAELSMKGKKSTKPSSAYIVSITAANDAPSGTGTSLIKAVINHCKIKGLKEVAYGIRLPGLRQSGLVVEDYLIKIDKGSIKEKIYIASKNAGGKNIALVEDYFHDPDSLNYGLIVYHGDREI